MDKNSITGIVLIGFIFIAFFYLNQNEKAPQSNAQHSDYIEDSENNITRFVILSKEAVDPDPTNDLVITSCIFKVRNIPAALYKALGGFATNRVNLLKLESYMIDGSFASTQFYVDIEGHPRVGTVRLALEELGFFSKEVKILGVYKAHNERNKN